MRRLRVVVEDDGGGTLAQHVWRALYRFAARRLFDHDVVTLPLAQHEALLQELRDTNDDVRELHERIERLGGMSADR